MIKRTWRAFWRGVDSIADGMADVFSFGMNRPSRRYIAPPRGEERKLDSQNLRSDFEKVTGDFSKVLPKADAKVRSRSPGEAAHRLKHVLKDSDGVKSSVRHRFDGDF